MTAVEQQSRPGGGSEAAKSAVAARPQSTVGTPRPHVDRADALARLRDCYAVVVAGKTVRKHLYFNLPAAQRAVARAKDRGATAHLVLVRLVPVDHRQLDQLDEAVITDER